MTTRILVTGGAGLIGSHLCARLLADGNEVVCIDNFGSSSRGNIQQLLDHPNFELHTQDVQTPLNLEVDQIYNLACPASPVRYQEDPVNTIKTSVLGAINTLDLARRLKVPVLQASTSEVYGDPLLHPQPESYWGNVNPIGPRACYDEGKRCAETLFFDHHRQYETSIKLVRIFNTYGPNMDPCDGRVVSNFVVQALRGEDVTIYGDGSQTRSFCYVTDLVEGLVLMMKSSKAVIGPINLGNPSEFTIAELAELVVEMTRSGSKVVYRSLPTDDPRQRRPDIGQARSLLHWTPSVSLREGLRQTIAYFDKQLSQNVAVAELS